MKALRLVLVLALLAACRGADPPSPVTPAPATPAPATPAPTPEPTPEVPAQMRGVWVHLFDDTLKTASGIEAMLDRIVAAGANTVIAEVVRRHDAYYDSRVLPRSTDPALEPGLDVLGALVGGAQERGLAVHAWYPAAPAYHHVYADIPWPPGWVWEDHGPRAPEADRWVTRTRDGRWGDYLDLGVPDVQEHILAIAVELATAYDVDAVHVDYLRYPSEDSGYHPTALARFRADTGRADLPTPTDPEWSAWRRTQTHELMRRIRDAVNPDVAVSIAAYAAGEGPTAGRPFTATRPYTEVFQEWPAWVEEGLVDAVFPMTYFAEARHGHWFADWLAFHADLAARTETVVAPGIGAWLNPVDAGASQVARALEVTDGAIVYSYQQNANTEPHHALLDRLGAGAWAEPAPAPRLR